LINIRVQSAPPMSHKGQSGRILVAEQVEQQRAADSPAAPIPL
jgi:hypothetical protein